MYQEITRPLTETERRQLEGSIGGIIPMKPSQVLGKAALWLGALGACGIIFALPFKFIPNLLLAGGLAMLAAIGGLFCLAGLVRTLGTLVALQDLEQQFKRREAPEIEAALRDGRARVQQAEATAVVEFTVDEDDEGSIYAFDVGERRTLIVDCADWPPPDGPWPNSRFELVRTLHGERVVAVNCQGQRLRPLRVIKFEDCDEQFGWSDELAPIVNQSLEDFVRASRA